MCYSGLFLHVLSVAHDNKVVTRIPNVMVLLLLSCLLSRDGECDSVVDVADCIVLATCSCHGTNNSLAAFGFFTRLVLSIQFDCVFPGSWPAAGGPPPGVGVLGRTVALIALPLVWWGPGTSGGQTRAVALFEPFIYWLALHAVCRLWNLSCARRALPSCVRRLLRW